MILALPPDGSQTVQGILFLVATILFMIAAFWGYRPVGSARRQVRCELCSARTRVLQLRLHVERIRRQLRSIVHFGRYQKTAAAIVTGAIGWGSVVISSASDHITASEWLALAVVFATALGVYAVPNALPRGTVRPSYRRGVNGTAHPHRRHPVDHRLWRLHLEAVMANPSLHYIGSNIGTLNGHARCTAVWQGIVRQHTGEYRPPPAYNFGVCNDHGSVLRRPGLGDGLGGERARAEPRLTCAVCPRRT